MSNNNSFIDRLTETKDGKRLYQQEHTILNATELMCQLMQENNVSRSELAARLGKTKGYVTQLLDGRANMTIRTISDVFFALDRSIHFQDCPLDVQKARTPVLQFVWGPEKNQWYGVGTPVMENETGCFERMAG